MPVPLERYTTGEAQSVVRKMIKADMDLDARGLFSGDLQGFPLQPCRQKETGSRAQGLNLGLYQLDLALVLCPQQHSKDACDPQPGALGGAASVSLVHQTRSADSSNARAMASASPGSRAAASSRATLSSRSAGGLIQPSWIACWISFSAAG